MEYVNKQYLLDKRPTGMPKDDCWKLNENLITSLKKNEIIIEVKYLSIDPYMRGRMNDSKSYAAPAKIGTRKRRRVLSLLFFFFFFFKFTNSVSYLFSRLRLFTEIMISITNTTKYDDSTYGT